MAGGEASESYLGVVKPPAQPRGLYWPPSAPQVPVNTAESESCSKKDLARQQAVCVIEKWWRRSKDRRVFHMLKQAVCASEYSLTQEILRKVTPVEAQLLVDPAIQAKIKFRFGGERFPPLILFKIFTCMSSRVDSKGTGGIKYLSGSRMIKPASEAAADAQRQMGSRKFYDQMLEDACQHQQHRITDEVDVTNMKDYMQYMANMDERPAYLGGKDNTWRQLNLTSLPRHTPLHNLVDLLEDSQLDGTVSLQQLHACTHPLTQQQQLRVISSLSEPRLLSSPQRSKVRSEASQRSQSGGQRRSRQARRRAEKMRRMYQEGDSSEEGGREEGEEGGGSEGEGEGVDKEAWEEEAEDLYEWTQKLSFADIR